ncbi:MAG: hypothetical protein A4E74_00559 [Syntrophus sp. PtaB.Bin075]|nr:MAG: hypothetical protein A4E74_00559 [Syntrophus sp. PtaB.Bin075]
MMISDHNPMTRFRDILFASLNRKILELEGPLI